VGESPEELEGDISLSSERHAQEDSASFHTTPSTPELQSTGSSSFIWSSLRSVSGSTLSERNRTLPPQSAARPPLDRLPEACSGAEKLPGAFVSDAKLSPR